MKNFISNPFVRLAGGKAMTIGIMGILLTGLVGWMTGAQYDGALDIHFSTVRAPWYFNLVAGILNWVSLAAIFGLFSHIFSKGHFRWVDVLGTQAFARIPMFLAGFTSYLVDAKALEYKLQVFLDTFEFPPFSGQEILGVTLMTLLLLLIIIWLIAWTWKAYTYTANIKGGTAVLSFIGGLLLAEILSKVLINIVLSVPLIPNLSEMMP